MALSAAADAFWSPSSAFASGRLFLLERFLRFLNRAGVGRSPLLDRGQRRGQFLVRLQCFCGRFGFFNRLLQQLRFSLACGEIVFLLGHLRLSRIAGLESLGDFFVGGRFRVAKRLDLLQSGVQPLNERLQLLIGLRGLFQTGIGDLSGGVDPLMGVFNRRLQRREPERALIRLRQRQLAE